MSEHLTNKQLQEKIALLEHHVATITGSHDKTREGVKSIIAGVGQNLAAMKANLDSNSEALEQFDIFNQIWGKMFIRICEKIEYHAVVGILGKAPSDITQEQLEGIKTAGREWFTAAFNIIKEEVKEEREAYLKELRQRAKEEMERQSAAEEQAKKEEAVAEAALRNAEQPTVSAPGGQGSSIPEGAQVFGGV